MSLSYDSLIFFITSSSALAHASMEPFTVMVRSGLYRVKSWRLDRTMEKFWHWSKYYNIKNEWCFMNGLQRLQRMSISHQWTQSYGEIVILVPVSCSIFFRLRPSFPINLPTKLLCASIFSGISSVLHKTDMLFNQMLLNSKNTTFRSDLTKKKAHFLGQ